ncbi:MAG: hypothetical protein ACM30G_08740 [Micromonosporaceae bacterium]
MGDRSSHQLSDQRAANAHAASHGYGVARRQAGRLVGEWVRGDELARVSALLDEPDQAQTYAESVDVPFEDYLAELDAMASQNGGAPPTDERDRLHDFYLAGFDIGFRSALIEACAKITRETTVA